MHGWQKARIMYMVKNGSQHNMKPPTMMASVLAAFVSMRNRLACTLKIRLPTPVLAALLASSMALCWPCTPLSNWLQSTAAVATAPSAPHRNDSMFSLRFSVICIMCSMGLLLVISGVSPAQSLFSFWLRVLARYSRRCSNDVVPMLFDGFRWVPGNGGEMRGTLFDRRPRCMRSVRRVSSKRFCFDEPAITQPTSFVLFCVLVCLFLRMRAIGNKLSYGKLQGYPSPDMGKGTNFTILAFSYVALAGSTATRGNKIYEHTLINLCYLVGIFMEKNVCNPAIIAGYWEHYMEGLQTATLCVWELSWGRGAKLS